MSQNKVSKNTSVILNNSNNIGPNINNSIESQQHSLSSDILLNSTGPKIISKKFIKIKLILKRPKKIKMQKSSSPRKIQNKILTFQKTPKHDKTLVYNRKLHSERNKINVNYNNKYLMNLNNMKFSLFKISKAENKNCNDIIFILMNLVKKMILKLKKVFLNKIKYYNKVYIKKNIGPDININMKNHSLPLPLLSNTKNFLEEMNQGNKTITYKNNNNKSNEIDNFFSSENDSYDKNLTIISKAEKKKLKDSISTSQRNEINDEDNVNNENYSYDKNEIIFYQDNFILKELKDELENDLPNKEIISTRKNKLNKESLLFSDGKVCTMNKSENKIKDIYDNEEKNNKSIKKMKFQFTPDINSKKKQKFFIENISFEKIEVNDINESFNAYDKNKKIDFMNSNNNSINNINKKIINYNLKNKNMKEYYENTYNSVEETTNINENENNPINRINYEEEKFIFNNSNLKNGDFEIINKKLLNNSNETINIKENIIEKNGELFYPVDESINLNINNNKTKNQYDNSEEEEEIDIKGKNKIYSQYTIVDKSKRIISFLSNQDDNNCDNNKAFKAQIPLDAYFNIIKKILPKKNKLNIAKEERDGKDNINKNKYKVSFSVRSYETFIKKLIDEIPMENNNNYICDCDYDDIFKNDVDDLENKLKYLKNCVLYLLVKKHYLKSSKEKLKLVSENNHQIEKQKNEIYILFQKIKNGIKTSDIPILLNVLKEKENISKRDIKVMKIIYQKEKSNKVNKSLLNYGSLILPFFYIAKFLIAFQK